VLLGTVKGDLHDIGKNLVGMMCEGAGFEMMDLGTDAEPQQFLEAIKGFEPDIVGMSALLTTTMRSMGDTGKALEEAGLCDQVKVMIGGAPRAPTEGRPGPHDHRDLAGASTLLDTRPLILVSIQAHVVCASDAHGWRFHATAIQSA
jgi:cobalamin-dependent methionine synthase I